MNLKKNSLAKLPEISNKLEEITEKYQEIVKKSLENDKEIESEAWKADNGEKALRDIRKYAGK